MRIRRLFQVAGEGREKAIRSVLLVALFALCGVGFWFHFEQRFAQIEAEHAFQDETGTVTRAQREILAEYADRLRQAWGVKTLVHIRRESVPAPKLKTDTLFVGVAPGRRLALVLAPPLVKKALPPGFTFGLETRLDECAASRPAAGCVAEILHALDETLSGR